jgi:acyl-CoA synthetase (AMP-forming)/AMP-acid ligase II
MMIAAPLPASGMTDGARAESKATIIDSLLRWADTDPERTAFHVVDGDNCSSLTYAALRRRVARLARTLAFQPNPDAPVLLIFPTGLDFIVAFLACLASGRPAVPVAPPRNARQARATGVVAASARPTLALADAETIARCENWITTDPVLADLEWLSIDDLSSTFDDTPEPLGISPLPRLAYLQYTSGSTGNPQGVEISHANVMANAVDIAAAFELDPAMVSCSWLPHYHDMGLLAGVLVPLATGMTCVLISPMTFLMRPRSWFEAIDRFRVDVSGGPNFALDLCVSRIPEAARAGLDLSSLRLVFCGAEPVQAATLQRFADAFSPAGLSTAALYPCYGLAEATLWVAGRRSGLDGVASFERRLLDRGEALPSADGPGARRLVSCGAWRAPTEVRIVSEAGAPLPDGRLGEIWIAGPGVAGAYYRNPERSAEVFGWSTDGSPRHFMRTGDIGFVHQGELFIAGRLKDVIVVAGRNLHAVDVEEAVRREAPEFGATAIVAFGLEQEERETLHVLVERPPKYDGDAHRVFDKVRTALTAEFDVGPHTLVLVRHGSLPRTTSGKLRRRECRERFVRGDFPLDAQSHA